MLGTIRTVIAASRRKVTDISARKLSFLSQLYERVRLEFR